MGSLRWINILVRQRQGTKETNTNGVSTTHTWRRGAALYFSLIQLSLLLNGEPSWSHVGMAEHSCHNIAEPALNSDRFSNGLIQMCVLEHYKLLSINAVHKKSLVRPAHWRTFKTHTSLWHLLGSNQYAARWHRFLIWQWWIVFTLKAPLLLHRWNYIQWDKHICIYTTRFAVEPNRFHAPLL
jgi:hypothetical protein